MDIPTYIKNANQENYHELFNQIIRIGLSNNGWTVPNLTTAQITQIQDMMPLGTIWFNTDLAKLVVKTGSGPTVTEIVQSI